MAKRFRSDPENNADICFSCSERFVKHLLKHHADLIPNMLEHYSLPDSVDEIGLIEELIVHMTDETIVGYRNDLIYNYIHAMESYRCEYMIPLLTELQPVKFEGQTRDKIELIDKEIARRVTLTRY